MVARIKASQIPANVLREIKGTPKRKSEKTTAWKDVPPSWSTCQGHEIAWWAGWGGTCPFCPEDAEREMYVQLDEYYHGHPKTLRLIEILGPEADTYPPRLWAWALQYAKDGVMQSPAMIETACRWRGVPGRLASALIEAGFVDQEELTIHNWMKRTGQDIERYEAKKERLRERRRNCSGTVPENSGNVPPKRSGEELNGADLNGTERSEVQPGSLLGHLMGLARRAKIAGRAETIRSYIEAWMARSDAGRVEQILMDPWTRGRTVIEIQDRFFGKETEGGGSWKDLLGGKQ